MLSAFSAVRLTAIRSKLMTIYMKDIAAAAAVAVLLFTSACSDRADKSEVSAEAQPTVPVAIATQPEAPPEPEFPDLQAELTDDRYKKTSSPLGTFDFKNFSYPLPRGWQNPDNADITLTDGHLKPVSVATDIDMDPDELAEKKARRRIGMSYVTAKFMDANGDGQDEAFVILKIETTGAAIPQIVYVYEWKDDKPLLVWHFRTGDRADGGLKDIRLDNGELVIELYGQDRFILGETETMKITGDEEQLCCPTFFTRTFYKWNGNEYLRQKERLTFSVQDPNAAPVENMAEIVNKAENQKKSRRPAVAKN